MPASTAATVHICEIRSHGRTGFRYWELILELSDLRWMICDHDNACYDAGGG